MAEHVPSLVIWGDGSGTTFKATVDAVNEGQVNFDIVGVITNDPGAGILEKVRLANENCGMDIEPFVADAQNGRRQTPEAQEAVLSFLEHRGANNLALMGALTIMGELIVNKLNGDVPELALPKTLEGARALMVPGYDGFETYLPRDFPKPDPDTGRYGLISTHPAPTIVTANTWGILAQRRMVNLSAAESGHTLHVVAKGVDTGPIIAFNRFPTRPVPPEASEDEIAEAAARLFKQVQTIEKAHLPLDLQMQLDRRQRFLGQSSVAA